VPQEDRELQAVLQDYAAKGFTLAFQLLGNRDDAAETVQEGLLALWRHRAKLDPSRNPKGWFYRVVRNLCVDRLRRRRLATAAPLEAAGLQDEGSADPARIVQDNEYRTRLRLQLESLPPNLREILFLRDFHDLSYAELAEVLSIPPGTVMSRLHRARMELRARMRQGSDRSARE
jgi:RNA polymerase sigma-70 factor (ECF subfamily)